MLLALFGLALALLLAMLLALLLALLLPQGMPLLLPLYLVNPGCLNVSIDHSLQFFPAPREPSSGPKGLSNDSFRTFTHLSLLSRPGEHDKTGHIYTRRQQYQESACAIWSPKNHTHIPSSLERVAGCGLRVARFRYFHYPIPSTRHLISRFKHPVSYHGVSFFNHQSSI